MEHVANEDEEELSLLTLQAATRNVIRYLEACKEEKKQSDGNAQPDRHEEQKAKDHSEYVNHRLRELAAFERRIDGNKKRKV
jgi:hypothetical protein